LARGEPGALPVARVTYGYRRRYDPRFIALPRPTPPLFCLRRSASAVGLSPIAAARAPIFPEERSNVFSRLFMPPTMECFVEHTVRRELAAVYATAAGLFYARSLPRNRGAWMLAEDWSTRTFRPSRDLRSIQSSPHQLDSRKARCFHPHGSSYTGIDRTNSDLNPSACR